MSSKEDFLKCFKEPADKKGFLEFISKHADKEDSTDLEHIVSSLTAKELETCWAKLSCFVTEILGSLSEIQTINEEAEEVKHSEEFIVAVTRFATIIIKSVTNLPRRMPTGLLEFASFFNEIIITCPNASSLTVSVVKLCELWWKKDLPHKKKHCTHAFYHLLKKSLRDDAKKADVKRVWLMHKILAGISLDDDEATLLRSLLLKASKSSLYLKLDEGVKFIGSLFTLSDEFTKTLHEGIKIELVTDTTYRAKRYGHVYLEAFAAIPKENRELFNEDCLQDLLFLGVHVKSDTDARFSANMHAFLHVLHVRKKTNRDVGIMLYQLYEPFLWKCLSVPNCVVRSNAVTILLDLFPWENPATDIVENDSILNKQFNLFEDLLVDPVSLVRRKTIMGLCKVLQLYWELFPTRSVQKYMEILTSKSLVDATSSEVRLAAVTGFLKLLEQRLALPTLKVVLQKWGCAFNDVNVKVRLAMAELLLKVKFIRSIKYWDIVPIDDIVDRLAEDEQFVSSKLAKLVFNSYHPQNQADEILLDRAITLLKLNGEASKRMYMLSSDLLEMNKGVKFIIIIVKAVKLQYKRHSKHMPADNEDGGGTPKKAKRLFSHDGSLYESDNDSGKENQENEAEEGGEACSELDKEVMSGLLDIAAILFRLYQKWLREERYSGHQQLLVRACSKTLPKMMAFYKNYPELSRSIVTLASFLPSSSVSTIVGYCKSRLHTAYNESEYEILLQCLINWRRGDDILEVATEWLEAGMKVTNNNTSRRSNRVRGVKFIIPTSPRPDLAITFMKHCISQGYSKTVLLEKNRDDMMALLNILESIPELVEKRMMSHEPLGEMCTDGFLQDVLPFYLRLTAVMHKKDVFNATERFVDVIDALDRILLKVLENIDVEYNEQDVSLAVDLINNLLFMSSQLILAGFAEKNFIVKTISLAQRVLRTNSGDGFIQESARVLFQVADYAYCHDKHVMLDLLSGPLINLFEDLMKRLAVVKDIAEIEANLRLCLQETLLIYSNIHNQSLFSNICHMMITVALGCQVKIGLEEVSECSQCLMLALASRAELLHMCMEQLQGLADADAFESENELAAALHIVTILPKKKASREISSLVKAMVECKGRLQEDSLESIGAKIQEMIDALKKRFGIVLPCG